MASKRSSLKRPIGGDDDIGVCSKKFRTRDTDIPPLSLLSIPIEVRQLILAELLRREDPLEFKRGSDYYWMLEKETILLMETSPLARLYPAVLRTCKKLYLEGSRLLYSNAVNLRVGTPFFTHYRSLYALGRLCGRDVSGIPAAVVAKMSKVRIQLFAHHQWERRQESLRQIEDGLENFAILLRKAPNWLNVTVQMFHVYKSKRIERSPRNARDNARFAAPLRHLRYIRNRSSVAVSGLTDEIVSSLPAAMTSTQLIADLPLALNALNTYVASVLPAPDSPTRKEMQHRIDLCEQAVWREDHNMFQVGRKRAMAALARLLKYREKTVFNHDPDTWATECFVSVKDERDDAEIDRDTTIVLDMEASDEDDNDTDVTSTEGSDLDAYDLSDSSTHSEDDGDDEDDEDDEDVDDDEDDDDDNDDAWWRHCPCEYCRNLFTLD